jgi:hypothetical protein
MPLPIHWQTAGNVRFADVSKRLETATLEERYELLTFVRLHYAKIRPRISDRWLMLEMVKYFLECISREYDAEAYYDNYFDSPFNAARQMVKWFNWYRNAEKDCTKVHNIADIVTDCYRNGSDGCRQTIEKGFLENALETPENRSFFQGWADDPVLADAHRESLRKGLAHEGTDKP